MKVVSYGGKKNDEFVGTEYKNPPFFFGRKGDYSKFSYF